MQPIRMTRAEYEAKYGSKPVISTSTLDTTPAPVRMTRAEYEQTYGVKPFGEQPKKNWAVENLSPFSETNINRLVDIPSDIKESFQGLQETAKDTISSVNELWRDPNANIVQKVVGTGLAPVSGGLTMAGQATIAPVKVLTTDEFENALISKLGAGVQEVKESGVGQWFKKQYDDLDPGAKVTLSKILAPAANIVTSVAGAGTAPKVLKTGSEVIDQAVPDLGSAIKTTTEKFKVRGDEKALQGVVDSIAKVEDKYVTIRKGNKYKPEQAVTESRTRIAQSGVLENAVDESGRINGELAAKAYKAEYLDGTENIVRKNLEAEKKTVSPQEVRTYLETAVMDSGLEGADLLSALKSIDTHIEGLSKRADELGNIPLYKIQDAKVGEYNNINFNTPPETKTFRKAIAGAYKDLIEEKSSIQVEVDGKVYRVPEINRELGKFLGDVERLQALDGKIVDKGKIGKYAASLAGTAVGMGAGASVGGGFGSAVGGIIGGEVTSRLVGRQMQGAFRGGGTGLPENKILAEAKKGMKTDLRKSDKVVGAPKDVPKTKEINKIEAQIKNNVKLQEKAIKAGNFELVAKLKEIYSSLVERLKEQVRFVRENIKSEGGYIKNPLVKGDNQSIPRSRNQRNTTTPANTNSISSTVPKLDAEVNGSSVKTPSTNLLEEAKKYKSVGQITKQTIDYARIEGAELDPSTIKLSGDVTETTAKQRAANMNDPENNLPVTLKVNKDGTLQVVDGNARVTAFSNQGKTIKTYIIDLQKSDKDALNRLFD